MSYFIEKYYPFGTAAAGILAVILLQGQYTDFVKVYDKISGNAIVISGTMIGFYLTITTIINTIQTRRMKFIKDSGLYPTIQSYLNNVILAHLAVITAILFLPLIAEERLIPMVVRIIRFGLLFLIFYSWMLSIRFTTIFVKLLADPPAKDSNASR